MPTPSSPTTAPANQGGTQNPYNHKAERLSATKTSPTTLSSATCTNCPLARQAIPQQHTQASECRHLNWRISGVQRYLGGQPISFFGANGIPGFDKRHSPQPRLGTGCEEMGHSIRSLSATPARPLQPFSAPARPATGIAPLSRIPTRLQLPTFRMSRQHAAQLC